MADDAEALRLCGAFAGAAALLLVRMGRRAWSRKRHFAEFVRAVPFLVPLLISWSVGETSATLHLSGLTGEASLTKTPLHVCIDATSWANDRGFGRFTREIVKALLARDEGFRYTLLFDQLPEEPLPPGAEILTARTGLRLNQSAVGSSARSPAYFLKMARLATSVPYDVFFFPTLYSYFPLLQRKACVVCYHDATAERFPELLFPTQMNHWLWRAKTALAHVPDHARDDRLRDVRGGPRDDPPLSRRIASMS